MKSLYLHRAAVLSATDLGPAVSKRELPARAAVLCVGFVILLSHDPQIYIGNYLIPMYIHSRSCESGPWITNRVRYGPLGCRATYVSLKKHQGIAALI